MAATYAPAWRHNPWGGPVWPSRHACAATSANDTALRAWRLDQPKPPYEAAGGIRYAASSAGTLPPLAASFIMTCLCSHMFIVAESVMSPL